MCSVAVVVNRVKVVKTRFGIARCGCGVTWQEAQTRAGVCGLWLVQSVG